MKKAKLHEIVTCVLFCGFIGIMGLAYLLMPKSQFSELEKRQLEAFPELTWDTLVSGDFGTNLETYMADHMPGRNFFVGVSAYYDLLFGQQSTKSILVAQGDRLVEAPLGWDQEKDQAQVEKNMRYINRFAEKLGQNVDLILVPSAGFILEDSILGLHNRYQDDVFIDRIYDLAGDGVRCMDLISVYANAPDPQALYYRTDHHWTSLGAWMAYSSYMQCVNREYARQDFFTVETHSGFRGTTYSRSGLWLTAPDDLQLWYGSPLRVENSTTGTSDSPFYLDRLQEMDMYTVFLDGNQPLVRIYNENNVGKGKILVIRDSYANCLGPMLAESYEEVVMIDLRYYHFPASQLMAQEQFDQILVLYSLYNFMTDSNFPFLN